LFLLTRCRSVGAGAAAQQASGGGESTKKKILKMQKQSHQHIENKGKSPKN
jgi:hypothetical protein